MNYIKQILNYFFKHDVSEDLKSRVYDRLIHSQKDDKLDEVLKQLWDETESNQSVNWETAYREVESVIHRDDKIRPFRPWTYWIKVASVWFIPFVMLCLSGYFYFSGSKVENVKIPSVSYVQHYAGLGEREQVILPDGSMVWLNSGSTLLYPSTFMSSERSVYLMGEGFFDVAKDSVHPFVVNTRFLKMQVLGTTFNVSAYPEDIQVKTTLETGALKVNLQNDTTKYYYLKPNYQLVYTPSTNKVEHFHVKASDYSDWRMGGLFFNNIDFEQAMKILERTYGVKIHIRTSVYNNQKIYVHYNKNESLENVFHILKIMIPELEYKLSGNFIYIE